MQLGKLGSVHARRHSWAGSLYQHSLASLPEEPASARFPHSLASLWSDAFKASPPDWGVSLLQTHACCTGDLGELGLVCSGEPCQLEHEPSLLQALT